MVRTAALLQFFLGEVNDGCHCSVASHVICILFCPCFSILFSILNIGNVT